MLLLFVNPNIIDLFTLALALVGDSHGPAVFRDRPPGDSHGHSGMFKDRLGCTVVDPFHHDSVRVAGSRYRVLSGIVIGWVENRGGTTVGIDRYHRYLDALGLLNIDSGLAPRRRPGDVFGFREI